MPKEILLRHRDIENLDQLAVYQENQGFEAFKKVVTSMQPDEVTEVVKSLGTARARRSWFSDRDEVVFRGQEELASLRGSKCRRI
jgi:hypothetical protein